MVTAAAGTESRKIGEDIILMDDYQLDPVYEYEFTAYLNTAIEIIDGEGTLVINGKKYEVKAPCLITYLNGQEIRTNITKNTVQRSLVFTDRFLEDLSLNAIKFNDIRTLMIQCPVLPITKRTIYELEIFANALKDIAEYPDRANNIFCAKHLVLSLFYGPLFDLLNKNSESATFRAPKISGDFFRLLSEHFREEHNMGFYASKLCISERYLYTTVVSVTGKSPVFWIENYLIAEAKRLIEDRDLSILQISQLLHFAGLPSFNKFFKRKEGLNPSAYRRQISSDIC